MRELKNFELENIYGGFITTLTAVVTAVVLVIAAYKMITSESAKVKLPGLAEVSFAGKPFKKPTPSRSMKTKVVKRVVQEEPLKQLENSSATFTSVATNFLIKC